MNYIKTRNLKWINLEKSIVESLDGPITEIFPYLPYILQDIWEIGADPDTMLQIIDRNIEKRPLKILDLGCGKGAISMSSGS
jgi:2-polyprenyl-3-methyl-5-hydroxy-6-metoxy-1,4-benzoquinol methylase